MENILLIHSIHVANADRDHGNKSNIGLLMAMAGKSLIVVKADFLTIKGNGNN